MPQTVTIQDDYRQQIQEINDNGVIIKDSVREYSDDGLLREETIKEYDENGNLIHETIYDHNIENDVSQIERFYETNSQNYQETVTYNENDVIHTSVTYESNVNDNGEETLSRITVSDNYHILDYPDAIIKEFRYDSYDAPDEHSTVSITEIYNSETDTWKPSDVSMTSYEGNVEFHREYDEHGNMIHDEKYVNGELNYSVDKTYDENNNLIEAHAFNSDGYEIKSVINEYNQDGEIEYSSISEYCDKDYSSAYFHDCFSKFTDVFYDGDKRITHEEYYSENGELIETNSNDNVDMNESDNIENDTDIVSSEEFETDENFDDFDPVD